MGRRNGFEVMEKPIIKTGRVAGLMALAIAILVFPLLISNPYYLNVVNIIGLNAIIVVGLNLLIGYAGQISLGHAAFYGLGAYISGVLTATYGLSPWTAMCLAVTSTAFIAMLIGIPTLKLRGHYLVMATLGFNLIVNIIMVQWDAVTGGPSGLPGIPSLALGSLVFDNDHKMYYLIWGVAFASIVMALNLVDSRVGRGLRALHGSEPAASAVGVQTDRYKVNIFILSAAYASLAGSLYAYYLTFISPKTFDIFFSVELVTMVIVGGMGSIWGALFGTVFLTILPNLLHFFDEYKDIVYGLVLVLILIFVPEGLAVWVRNRWFAFFSATSDSPADQTRSGLNIPVTAKLSSALMLVPGSERDRPEDVSLGIPPGLSHDRIMAREAMSFRDPILKVDDICVNFGGIMALASVSFELPGGSITSIIGPNGAGKTTMINVIAGIYKPQRGKVMFAGMEVTGNPPHEMARRGLTRTFQNLQIFENMTILENVMVGLHANTRNGFGSSMIRMGGFRKEERQIKEKARDVLRLFGLEAKADLLACNLSFGEQKRLEMARAFVPKPLLMLLDEPVAGLNMTEKREVAQLIAQIKAQGVSVLLVEHDMNLVMSLSDKVVVLNYGNKIADGSPQEVQTDREVLTAYLGGAA